MKTIIFSDPRVDTSALITAIDPEERAYLVYGEDARSTLIDAFSDIPPLKILLLNGQVLDCPRHITNVAVEVAVPFAVTVPAAASMVNITPFSVCVSAVISSKFFPVV